MPTQDDRPLRYVVDYEDDVRYQAVAAQFGNEDAGAHLDLYMREAEFATLRAARRFAARQSAATIRERINLVDYWRDGIRCWSWDEETVPEED